MPVTLINVLLNHNVTPKMMDGLDGVAGSGLFYK